MTDCLKILTNTVVIQNTANERVDKDSHGHFSSQLQLRDQAERLFTKVGYLESRLGHLTTSSTDVSHRLVQSEEEKLKVGLVNETQVCCFFSRDVDKFAFFISSQISKELVEEKLQTNKLREQYEEQMFELKNKVI